MKLLGFEDSPRGNVIERDAVVVWPPIGCFATVGKVHYVTPHNVIVGVEGGNISVPKSRVSKVTPAMKETYPELFI